MVDFLVNSLGHLVDEKDVSLIIASQRNMLARFEKANEMLVNCNALATFRFDATNRDLKNHTQKLQDLKKEIDSIFKRIRQLRQKLALQYPDAFRDVASNTIISAVDEEDESDLCTTSENAPCDS